MDANLRETLSFLELLRPGGPWVLTAIAVDQKTVTTATFRDPAVVRAWLEGHGDANLYYHVNPTLRDLDKKAERTDVKALAFLHVDIDPRVGEDPEQERERALGLLRAPPGGLPPPTAIVFSGGGYNALWKLREPLPIDGDLERAEDAKRYNLQLEVLFQGDKCHNVDRILRLPGTVNWPNEKKRKKGRRMALAALVEWSADRAYDLAQFAKAPLVQTPQQKGFEGRQTRAPGNVRRLGSVDELPANVPNWCRVLIVQGCDPENVTKYPSRSEPLWAVCCELVRCGIDDETIFSVITDPDFQISASVLDKGSSAERYALRQIDEAREQAIAPELRELNARHAVVANYGGKCRVIEEVTDPTTSRPRLTFQSFEDFGHRYMHRMIQVGQDDDGTPIRKPLGKWWLQHAMRRQYDRIVFSPGREVESAYNLWRGFTCEARPGDCSLYLRHLQDNICAGNEEHYRYLLGWMACAVQRPDCPGYTAVVMRGRRGTGKSVFATTFGSLWARHFLHVSNSQHLVGNFNSHLRDCIVLFGDEAFYAGDKKHESILKTLITEETLSIEAKGVDVEMAQNCLHLILASNDTWVVPAGWDERRFFVLDVTDAKAQDGGYFGAIRDQMFERGGRSALLHLLLTFDLSGFDVRKAPKTKALQDQKELSLDQEEEWWRAKLVAGRLLPTDEDWTGMVVDYELLYDFVQEARSFAPPGRRSNRIRLIHFLRRVLPEPIQVVRSRKPIDARMLDGSVRQIKTPYCWVFPSLEKCRRHWDELGGVAGAWTTPAEAEGRQDAEPY